MLHTYGFCITFIPSVAIIATTLFDNLDNPQAIRPKSRHGWREAIPASRADLPPARITTTYPTMSPCTVRLFDGRTHTLNSLQHLALSQIETVYRVERESLTLSESPDGDTITCEIRGCNVVADILPCGTIRVL